MKQYLFILLFISFSSIAQKPDDALEQPQEQVIGGLLVQEEQPPEQQRRAPPRSVVEAMSGGNFSCPFKNESDSFRALRSNAQTALSQLRTLQNQCREATQVGASQNAANAQLDNDITNLSSPISSDCVEAENVVQGRVQNIQYLAQEYQLPAPASSGLTRIRNGSQVQGMYQEFRECIRVSYSDNTADIDMDCIDSTARVSIARAQETGRIGTQQLCGQISTETGQAISRAMATFESLMSNPQCSSGAPIGASLLNLGVGLAMSNPVSAPVALITRFAQSFLSGLFGRRYERAEQAMRAIEGDETRRSVQCLFMNMHNETLACGAQDAASNRQQLEQQLSTAEGEILTLQNQLEAATPGMRPEEAISSCAPSSQQRNQSTVDGALNSISQVFSPVEEALLVETPDINQVKTAFLGVCQSYRPQRRTLSDIAPLEPYLQRLDGLCSMTTAPSLSDFQGALLGADGSKTTIDMRFAAQQVTPAMIGRAPAADPTVCVRELGGDLLLQYQRKSAEVRDLQRRISSLPSVDDATRSNSAMSELFMSFKSPLLRDNGTSLRLDQTIDRTWTAIREFCTAGSPSGQFRAYVNELHATCLLNASAYLYDHQSRIPVFQRNRNAETWENGCRAHFLNNSDRAPLANGTSLSLSPPPDIRSYETWQCQAYTNFERYKLALPANDNELFQEFCGVQSEGGRRDNRSPSGRTNRQ